MTFFKSRAGRGAALTLGYLALTLIMTYPLVFHFHNYVFAGMEDGSMSVWNLWWMRFSLFDLWQSPLHTDYLFYPDGMNLVFHSMPKVIGLVSIPLQYIAGLTIAYNLIVVSTFVLTGLTTYWLVHHLLGERLPAFIAGAFFAFCPYRMDQRPHLQLLSTMLVPVFILLLIKAREALAGGERRRPWILLALAGITLAATAYDSEYYSIFMLIFAALYLVVYFPLRLKRDALRRWLLLVSGLAMAVAIFAVLYLPMLIAAGRELAAEGDYVNFPALSTINYSSDLLAFFVPQATAKFLGPSFTFVTEHLYAYSDTTFLGWLALTLALAGVWRFRRSRAVWLWVFVALAFGLLALGPYLVIDGTVSGKRAPYLFITKVPLLKSARVPARFGMMTMLAVAVLAGYGSSALLGCVRKISGKTARMAVPAVAALILLVTLFEYRALPDLSSTSYPPVYAEIAASGMPGSVITLPMGWEASNDTTGMERTYVQLLQSEHERPIPGGMVARAPKEAVFRGIYTPVIDFLADPVRLKPSSLDRDPEAIGRFMERYQVAFIVAQKSDLKVYIDGAGFGQFGSELTPEALARVDEYVTGSLKMERFAETDEIIAYRRR